MKMMMKKSGFIIDVNYKKRLVCEYAPKNAVIVDGKYALISSLEKVVSPYDENEIIDVALAVDMSEKVFEKNGKRWANTYRLYWFGNDKEPSMISDEQIAVEISPMIFARKKTHVCEYAPKNAIIVKGRFALIDLPVDVKDGCEIKAFARAVDMSNKIVRNKWARVYRIYWLRGDKFEEPSQIEKDDLVDISKDIFCRW